MDSQFQSHFQRHKDHAKQINPWMQQRNEKRKAQIVSVVTEMMSS